MSFRWRAYLHSLDENIGYNFLVLFVEEKKNGYLSNTSTNDETFTNGNDLLSLKRDVKCIRCDNNGSFFFLDNVDIFISSIKSIRSPTQRHQRLSLSLSINNKCRHTNNIIILNSRCSITGH